MVECGAPDGGGGRGLTRGLRFHDGIARRLVAADPVLQRITARLDSRDGRGAAAQASQCGTRERGA